MPLTAKSFQQTNVQLEITIPAWNQAENVKCCQVYSFNPKHGKRMSSRKRANTKAEQLKNVNKFINIWSIFFYLQRSAPVKAIRALPAEKSRISRCKM